MKCTRAHQSLEKMFFSEGIARLYLCSLFSHNYFSCYLRDLHGLYHSPEKMKVARETLSRTDVSVVSVSSGCELFMRFITLSHLELEQATVSIMHNETRILIPGSPSSSSPLFPACFFFCTELITS